MLSILALLTAGALAQADPFSHLQQQKQPTADQPLLLAPCSASPAQAWNVNDGSIGVITPRSDPSNVCVCAPLAGGAGALTLQICEAGPPLHALEVGFTFTGKEPQPVAIPWYPNAHAPASGLCVTATAAGSAPQLQPCQPGAPSQLWSYTAGGQVQSGGLCLEAAPPPPALLSSVFGSSMVLQRGQPAAVWGAAAPGTVVSVTLSGAAPLLSAPAGPDGRWAVSLPAMPAGTGFNLTVLNTLTGDATALTDLAFGDVYWCSGQSNLSGGNTPVAYAYNATAEEAAAADYPWVRLFTVGTPPGAAEPLVNLASPPRLPWARASPASAHGFSATCWFFGRTLADALGSAVPLGLVESAWGGTSIQVWLPPTSQAACGAPPSYPGGWPTNLSASWNSQTTPFAYNGSTSMRVSGIVWYQGESNSLTAQPQAQYYTCALPYLVASLRALFNSPAAHAAIVQLAPWASSAASYNLQVAELRAAQLSAGEDSARGMSVITAVDLGDPFGPIGSIHPRRKQPVGQRLGAAVLSHVYSTPTPYAGPRLAGAAAGGGAAGGGLSATLTFQGAPPLQLLQPSPVGPFANSSVCPTGVSPTLCSGFQLQGGSGVWYPAVGSLAAGGQALVLQAAGAVNETAVAATASGWSLWPITLLYSNGLPAFPWNATVG